MPDQAIFNSLAIYSFTSEATFLLDENKLTIGIPPEILAKIVKLVCSELQKYGVKLCLGPLVLIPAGEV